MSEKNINLNVNLYDQSGNFGAGHVSDSEIKGQTKLGGIINQAKETIKNTFDQKVEKTKFLEITISGEFESIDLADILRIQSELISKLKNTQKTSINIVDAESGSIKLTFEGLEDELKQIEALINSGEITKLLDRNIKKVKQIDLESEAKELRQKVSKRNKLVQKIRSRKFTGRRKVIGRKVQNVDLKFCDLKNTFLKNAYLGGANLHGADLSGADLSGADLSGANLSGVDLSGADLSGANLRNTKISKRTKLTSKWRKVWEILDQNANGQDLSREDLSNSYLKYVCFIEARLVQTDLYRSQLDYANFTKANLIGANLSNVTLNGADLNDADLSGANLRYSHLDNANLIYSNLIGVDLRDTSLIEADLTNADLSGAKVENAHFGDNKGISADLKRNLKSRGAIFEDSPPGDHSKVDSPTPSRV